MEFVSERLFSFTSKALAEDTFAVVEFSGRAGISRCYRFDVLLVTEQADIDLDRVMQQPARLVIHRQAGADAVINGVLASFQQQQAAGQRVFYRATLVPRLWWLTLTHHNQVFLDQTVVQVVEAVLKESGLTSRDYQFRLQSDYQPLRYVCQYDESHFDFISRRLEREGIYYFFEQTEEGEKIIFTDTAVAHQPSPLADELAFVPPSGLVDSEQTEVALSLVCRHNSLPKMVRLRDYNYRKPSLEVEASAMVDQNGRGQVYLYGEHFRSPEEGQRLARIRAQELLCRRQEFSGESTAPFLDPGYTFKLAGHYRPGFNQKYLAVEVNCQGSQVGSLASGIKEALGDLDRKNFYRNQFVAIAAGIQFRPPRQAQVPKITGTLNARIDAAGSGKYAELDEHGRYKVILPFDLSGRKDGKASAWLRMAQPYAGAGHGMHFPLHKGTEVLLSFIEGNPDRPVIAAAVPNAESTSPVTASDQTMAKITTAGGNKIHMEDREGSQRILLQSPTDNTWVRIGAVNDPDDEDGDSDNGDGDSDEGDGGREGQESFEDRFHEASEEHSGYKIFTGGWYVLKVGHGKIEVIGPLEQKIVFGNSFSLVAGAEENIVLGGKVDLHFPGRLEFAPEKTEFKGQMNAIRGEVTRMHGEVVDMTGQATRMEEQSIRMAVQATKMAAETIRLHGEVSDMYGEITEIHGEVTQLRGTVDDIAGDITRLSGQVTELRENITRIEGQSTEVAGSKTSLSGESTELAGEETNLTGASNEIAGLKSIL